MEDEEQKYTLHIDAAETPDEGEKKVTKSHQKTFPEEEEKPVKEKKKDGGIWGTLRFVSTALIIFIVLFFALNWNAYSTIILNKLGFLEQSEEMQQLEENGGPGTGTGRLPEDQEPQELMELSKDPEEQKAQIPPLALEVAPPDMRIVIPRINKNVPVVTISTEALVNRQWGRLEQQIQEALRDGVVHYPGTAFPDQDGNVVVTGHSSYFPWDPGRFKDVFALLHDVRVGDSIYMYYDQEKYKYTVYETKVVLPTEVDVLTQVGENRLTLITCTPVGTNLKRLIVLASPE
jgi:LPXTG-site transpeptidase (sortase) family protein